MAVPTAPYIPGHFFIPPPPINHLPNHFPPSHSGLTTPQWTSPPGLFPMPLGPPNYGDFISLGPPTNTYYHQGTSFHPANRGRPPFHARKGPQRGRGNVDTNRPAAKFMCKSCSKEYRTEENYKLHLQSHEKVGPYLASQLS